MKKSLLAFTVLVLSICLFTTTASAQLRGGGGSSSGLGVTFAVPVGTDIVLTFDQASTVSLPVLHSITYLGTVIPINGNLAQLSCLNFYQFFQVLSTLATYQHPAGCHQPPCLNPRCHE